MKTDDINSVSLVKTSGAKAPPHNPGDGEVTLKFFWPFSTIIALSVPLFLPCVLPADSHVDVDPHGCNGEVGAPALHARY